MKYEVQIISRETGKEQTVNIEAPTEQDAFDRAVKNGWIVGEIRKGKPDPKPSDGVARRLLLAIGIVLGVFLFIVFLVEPTDYDGIHNLGRMHNRSMGMMVSCFMVSTGVVGLILLSILEELQRKN